MDKDDVRSQTEAILQYKMNISYESLQNMTDEELLLEYRKFRWITKIENETYKKMK